MRPQDLAKPVESEKSAFGASNAIGRRQAPSTGYSNMTTNNDMVSKAAIRRGTLSSHPISNLSGGEVVSSSDYYSNGLNNSIGNNSGKFGSVHSSQGGFIEPKKKNNPQKS